MRLTNRIIAMLQKILLGSVAVTEIVCFLLLVFIGKNLTFCTRFTPAQSEQNHLRNQTYITEAQVLIIVLCISYTFLLPLVVYAAITRPKRIFFPLLAAVTGLNGLLVFLNLYFLTGASQYRSFMDSQYSTLIGQGKICGGNPGTICMVGTCTRLEVFREAQDMSIAFTVIDSLFSLVVIILGALCNKRRKSVDQLQLIV